MSDKKHECREAFEAWATKQGYNPKGNQEFGMYIQGDLKVAWPIWQAAYHTTQEELLRLRGALKGIFKYLDDLPEEQNDLDMLDAEWNQVCSDARAVLKQPSSGKGE